MDNFNQKVYKIVARIPFGMVTNYGHIARLAGSSCASRAVGYALNATPDDRDIPWHRVVYKDGSLAKLPSGNKTQYDLLKAEKISFTPDKKVDMKKHSWDAIEIEAEIFFGSL